MIGGTVPRHNNNNNNKRDNDDDSDDDNDTDNAVHDRMLLLSAPAFGLFKNRVPSLI